MELPNYNRQLMLQLHALRKERQFCDCTILVGSTPHQAHKLVLAASSLLFRSLFEGSDSISIDTVVVSSQEFSCLLDMAYTGRLPPGKHNLTRIIAAADSLQMFDVAVGCKNILTSLIKQSTEAAQPAADPCESQAREWNQTDVNNVTTASCHNSGSTQGCSTEGQQEVDQSHLHVHDVRDGVVDTEQLSDPSVPEELKGEVEGSAVRTACFDSSNCTDETAVEILSQKREVITEALKTGQPWIPFIQTWNELPAKETQVILDCYKGDPKSAVVLELLLDKIQNERGLSAQTLLLLLDVFKRCITDLTSQPGSQEEESCQRSEESPIADKTSHCELMSHISKLTELLTSTANVKELLIKAANNCQAREEKEVVLGCCGGKDSRQTVENLMDRVQEGKISQTGLLMLLQNLKAYSPDLAQLLEALKDTGWEAKEDHSAAGLLRIYRNRLSEVNLDGQILRQCLEDLDVSSEVPSKVKAVLLEEDEGAQGLESLLEAALERNTVHPVTVWRLLLKAGPHAPNLAGLLEELQEQPESQSLFQIVGHIDLLIKHKALILNTVRDIGTLESAVDSLGNDSERVMEFLQSCRASDGEREAVQQVLERVVSMETEFASPLCRLLSIIQQTLPRLLPLVEELTQAETEAEPEQTSQEAAPAESPEEDNLDVKRKRGASKSYTCQWCNKSYDFKCRLVMHRKRCPLSEETPQQCPECSKQLPTPRALQQHLSQDHSGPPHKRRKQLPVSCDLCDKTFAHSSGMLYHKRTEHFEEKPYVCEECGAKFAANSSLKNHTRLHTGEKPFQCKHCSMSFSVAAALSYHTKKKHSEGKMYACQYCEAVFAQSIELTRHVRTHTGDKPYVCRECGKGFSQANGLSVHLQTFHNIAEPHDCQKCQMSFATLEEHCRHLQEVHPKELHQCPDCSKLFTTAAQLDKHRVVHTGGKPYSCTTCQKSYQQLSGLWYHNRTTHPEVFAGQGSRPLKTLLQCETCCKAFSSRASLLKHQRTKHPEFASGIDQLDAHEPEKLSEGPLWRCLCCANAFPREEELQQHVCSEHVSQDAAGFSCRLCALSFPAQLQLQEHFLSHHLAVAEEGPQASTSQMVIQAEDSSAEGVEQVIAMGQSQLDGSQQVFVALQDGESATSSTGIVAVNMEDLLNGTVTFICEERQ